MSDNLLKWLCNWYQLKCNDDWEHNYGVMIETIDNPGWNITIDIDVSKNEIQPISWTFVEISADDWYGYKLFDGKFEASGDPSKLEFLFLLFKKIIEKE